MNADNKSNNGEIVPKIDETVFELVPGKIEKNPNNNKNFSVGFLFGFLVVSFLALGAGVSLFSAGLISIKTPSVATIEPKISPAITPQVAAESIENTITTEQARIKAETFINNNLMQPGKKITIKGIKEENGLYKISVSDGSTINVDTYMSKDGKKFFAQAMDLAETENKKAAAAQSSPAVNPNNSLAKNDRPAIELFVMSHCPYGTQIEKGILPVIDTLGNKINFEVKFVDYAMHGEKELTEELNQYCIQTNEPIKYNAYLKCFIESTSGNSEACLIETDINKSTLASCVAATDKKFRITANFTDKTTWKGNFPTFNIYKEDNAKYSIQGSPTLIINGSTANSGRDSASLLKTICSAFITPPEECDISLSTVSPAPGFGTGASAGASAASCGN